MVSQKQALAKRALLKCQLKNLTDSTHIISKASNTNSSFDSGMDVDRVSLDERCSAEKTDGESSCEGEDVTIIKQEIQEENIAERRRLNRDITSHRYNSTTKSFDCDLI